MGKIKVIIAEAGTHFAGRTTETRVKNAMFYADLAHMAGADYVKYQMYLDGGVNNMAFVEGDDKRTLHWWNCDLVYEDWFDIKEYCEDIGIGFMVSPFCQKGVEWAITLDCDYIKVASRNTAVFPYDICKGERLIISDGMHEIPPVDAIRLQCTSKYPTPMEEARWVRHDGLSDHSGTPYPAMDALARGAKAVEVHLSFDEWDRDRNSSVRKHHLKQICEFRDAIARMHEGAGRPHHYA